MKDYNYYLEEMKRLAERSPSQEAREKFEETCNKISLEINKMMKECFFPPFKDFPEEFKTEEMAKLAVKVEGKDLEHVPEDIKTEEICNIALKNNIEALPFVPKKWRNLELYEKFINYSIKRMERPSFILKS